MEYLNITFRLLAISQVALLTLFIAFSDNPNRVKLVCIGLMVGAMSYVGLPLIESYTAYTDQFHFLWFLVAIVPSLLLLSVFFIFEDSCDVPLWMMALVVVSTVSSLWFHVTQDGMYSSPLWLHVLKVFITAVAIAVVWRGRENDLVELRTKVRTYFILLLAIETMIIISVETLTQFNPPIWLDTATQCCILILTLSINFFFARLNPKSQLMRLPPAPTSVKKDTSDPVIVELLERMREERLYADHDLRVGTLAQMLNVPEYKLREKINRELGYRNFNHFVNHYRVEEAGVKLRKQIRTPVLTIAIDVGFRSISSFNTAFQAHFGLSPTQYRADTDHLIS